MSNQKDAHLTTHDVWEKMPFTRILKVISAGTLFSFLTSEIIFLYLSGGGISRFPENLVICISVLTVAFVLESFFFPDEIAILALYSSLFSVIFMVDYLFGSSTDPSILAGFFNLTRSAAGDAAFFDFIALGLVGGSLWIASIAILSDFANKARKLSIRQAFSALREDLTRIVILFDKHPWIAPVLIGLASLIVGILIGLLGG
jgi:hypothetical protein